MQSCVSRLHKFHGELEWKVVNSGTLISNQLLCKLNLNGLFHSAELLCQVRATCRPEKHQSCQKLWLIETFRKTKQIEEPGHVAEVSVSEWTFLAASADPPS